jgi:hypothetical protein
VVLPRGSVDLVSDRPAQDVSMVAAMATVLVREETHPALVDLLMQAAAEAHGGPGIFQRPGDFPKALAVDFPLSKEAERYYKSGKPFLQRYLPFWNSSSSRPRWRRISPAAAARNGWLGWTQSRMM